MTTRGRYLRMSRTIALRVDWLLAKCTIREVQKLDRLNAKYVTCHTLFLLASKHQVGICKIRDLTTFSTICHANPYNLFPLLSPQCTGTCGLKSASSGVHQSPLLHNRVFCSPVLHPAHFYLPYLKPFRYLKLLHKVVIKRFLTMITLHCT